MPFTNQDATDEMSIILQNDEEHYNATVELVNECDTVQEAATQLKDYAEACHIEDQYVHLTDYDHINWEEIARTIDENEDAPFGSDGHRIYSEEDYVE